MLTTDIHFNTLPCPFCSSVQHKLENRREDVQSERVRLMSWVECCYCGARGAYVRSELIRNEELDGIHYAMSAKSAVDKWNKRRTI